MNEDIVPGLLANIEDDFNKSFQSDDTLKTLYGKVQDGTATQADGEKFAHEVGRLTADVFHRKVTPEILPDGMLYYNIANRIIPPILKNNYGIVGEVMKQVIERMNHDAGLGIKFQEPEFESGRVHDLVWKASLDKYEKMQKMVETGLDTFTRSVADDCVRTNAEFQYEAGLSPRIERDTDGDCCSWCSDMAGTYDYKSAPKEVFARHANCGCTVEFLPGDGRRQNVHTKDWTSETESAMMNSEGFEDDERSPVKLEAQNLILESGERLTPLQREFSVVLAEQLADKRNARILYSFIAENPSILTEFTPESMKAFLEKRGSSVLPLSRGHLKGIRFEDGGGYKINYGGNGEFQYHPEAHSHHGGAYWKVTYSKSTTRYDLNGREVP